MWKCSQCKEECEDNFDSCWKCGTARGGSPSAGPLAAESGMGSGGSPIPLSASNPSKSGRRSIMTRYTDAYLIARTITGVGATVKIIGFVIGAGTALVSVVVGSQSVQYVIGGIVVGAIVAIPIYVLGILVAAQGQILKATLDSAVNTSPLLTKDEMRQIMSLE